MSDFGEGMRAAILQIIGSIIYTAIVSSLAANKVIPESYLLLFALINAAIMIVLVLAMPRWGILYTIGWIFAVGLFINSGLLSTVDIVIYTVAPLVPWGWRIWSWYDENYR